MSLKYIHQIWYQGSNKIPEKYSEYRKTWTKYNPNVQIIVWDEKNILNLIKQQFPEYYSWFQSLPLRIQKIDTAKLFILVAYGGAYVDMDMESLKPLNEIYDSKRVVIGEIGLSGFEQFLLKLVFKLKRPEINNGIILAPPNHPFLIWYLKCLKNTLPREPTLLEKMYQELYILTTVGPISLTLAVEEYPRAEELITVLPPDLLEPQVSPDDCSINSELYEKSYVIHHHQMTWASNFIKYGWAIRTNFRRYWWFIILILVFLVILVFLCCLTIRFS